MKYQWDFKPINNKDTGYEEILPHINALIPDNFATLDEAAKDKIVDDVIALIRTVNIFPIYYFTDDGIKDEIKKVIKKKDIQFENDTLITQSSLGLLVLDYLFPNLHHVESGNMTDNCMYKRFYDNAKLAKCLKRHMNVYGKISNMRTPFFMYGRFFWNTATNFSPMRAKAIYEKFCPVDGVIYDYSCGFGGRMLGALSSKNNYTYIGCEPCTDTVEHLNELGSYIESVTKRRNSFKIHQECSEDLKLPENSVDFAFSCPPFYGLERYSDEETQSINRWPSYQDWLEHYVRPTIRNIYKALKDDGLFGVDIYDCYWKNVKYHLVEDWTRIAIEEGFEFVQGYPIITRARKIDSEDTNTEKVYIFKKA